MAAIGRMNSPTPGLVFSPPHFPRNRHAFGWMAESRSMTVAAFALPIPKLMMEIPLAVAFGMGFSSQHTRVLCISANMCT